jgi:hypothetical protein
MARIRQKQEATFKTNIMGRIFAVLIFLVACDYSEGYYPQWEICKEKNINDCQGEFFGIKCRYRGVPIASSDSTLCEDKGGFYGWVYVK